MKLLIMGIDALDPFFIEDFLDDLPTFQWLRQDCERHFVHCDSAVANTASRWGSLYTTLPAREHGLTGLDLLGDIGSWLDLARKLEGLLWDRLNATGLSVGLLSLPLVWPAEIGNGWCVGGFPTPVYQFRQLQKKSDPFDAAEGLYSSPEVAKLAPPGYAVDAQDYAPGSLTEEDRKRSLLPRLNDWGSVDPVAGGEGRGTPPSPDAGADDDPGKGREAGGTSGLSGGELGGALWLSEFEG